MKIPKQFKLLGTIIKVRNKDKLTFDSDAWGLSVFRENKRELAWGIKKVLKIG